MDFKSGTIIIHVQFRLGRVVIGWVLMETKNFIGVVFLNFLS